MFRRSMLNSRGILSSLFQNNAKNPLSSSPCHILLYKRPVKPCFLTEFPGTGVFSESRHEFIPYLISQTKRYSLYVSFFSGRLYANILPLCECHHLSSTVCLFCLNTLLVDSHMIHKQADDVDAHIVSILKTINCSLAKLSVCQDHLGNKCVFTALDIVQFAYSTHIVQL